MKSTLIILVFLAMLACSAYVFFGAFGDAWRSLQSSRWPVTVGMFVNPCTLETLPPKESPTYAVSVLYVYTVNQKQYQSSQLAIGYRSSDNYWFHDRIWKRLANVEPVVVHYNPAKPQESVIAHSLPRGATLTRLLLSGLMLLFTGLAMLLVRLAVYRGTEFLKNINEADPPVERLRPDGKSLEIDDVNR